MAAKRRLEACRSSIENCVTEALKELLLCCTRNQDRITENMLKNPKWG